MLNPNAITPARLWAYVPQCFIGLFFMAAAFLKWSEAFFGPNRFPLSKIMEVWVSQRISFEFYASFMKWLIPYSDSLAILVIVLQGIAGLLLVLNVRTRLAGILIFFVQFNIYLAVYHQIELRNLNALALWVALYFFARPEMTGTLWKLMTFAVALIMASHLTGRAVMFGDPFLSSFSWQFREFAFTNMSSWAGLKEFVVWFFSGKNAALLWAASWWIKFVLALAMLTRYRLYAGALLLVYMFGVTLVWLSTFTCEGTFWVLLLYVWVTHERREQQSSGISPQSYLP